MATRRSAAQTVREEDSSIKTASRAILGLRLSEKEYWKRRIAVSRGYSPRLKEGRRRSTIFCFVERVYRVDHHYKHEPNDSIRGSACVTGLRVAFLHFLLLACNYYVMTSLIHVRAIESRVASAGAGRRRDRIVDRRSSLGQGPNVAPSKIP